MLKEDPCTEKFYAYFMQHYFNRCEMWVYCYRKEAKINTNMHIENFHRQLKHIYLDGKKVKRLDKVIVQLIKLTNDKRFDYLVKSLKGKIIKRATQNFKRHREGKNLNATIDKINDNGWKIFSSNNIYNLKKIQHVLVIIV